MRNPFKRQPTADPISAMREQRAALEAKASTLNTGKDRRPDATASVPPASSAVSVAIHEHLRAYAERLYAQVYKMEDADTRAEQERAAFRTVLHTPLASDAERLAYAKAVIERAAGVYGLECHGNTRAAWMPTAYRNLAFGEYAPESDMAPPTPAAAGPVASDLGVALAHEVVRYFGADPINPALDGDAALREQAETLLRTTAPAAHPGLSTVEAELTALVAEYEGFARVSDEAMAREDDAGLPLPENLENAIDRVRHFANLGREDTVRHVMALPATTLLGFGLKAQILEHDAGAAWDGSDADTDTARCRALLHGLIAAAGLSPIPRVDVTPDEIRGWLADPETAPGASRVKA
jgi:hypothetical protein